MIRPRMSRPVKALFWGTLLAVVVLATACGTEKINVPTSDPALHEGAVLFNQRCGGCHTFSYAGTHGSAQNVRTAQFNNGPNFDIRCERPVARVLYAIQNGGFSLQGVTVGIFGALVPEYLATNCATSIACCPTTTFCGITTPEKPPFWIA